MYRMTANIDGTGARFVYQNARFSGEDIESTAYPLVRIGPDTALQVSFLAFGSFPNATGGLVLVGGKPLHFFANDEPDAVTHYGESGDWHLVNAILGSPLTCAAQGPSAPPPDIDGDIYIYDTEQSPAKPPALLLAAAPSTPPLPHSPVPSTETGMTISSTAGGVAVVGLGLAGILFCLRPRRPPQVTAAKTVVDPLARSRSQQQPLMWSNVVHKSTVRKGQLSRLGPEQQSLLSEQQRA